MGPLNDENKLPFDEKNNKKYTQNYKNNKWKR